MSKRDEQIEVLYNQHYTDLLRRACILLHDEEDARDAVSDVMTRLMAGWPSMLNGACSPPMSWVSSS